MTGSDVHPFSVFAAAEECPQTLGLVSGPARLTFFELARRVAPIAAQLDLLVQTGRPIPVIADRRLDIVLLLYALAERGLAPLLIDPRLAPYERSQLVAAGRQPLCFDEDWTAPGPDGFASVPPPGDHPPHADMAVVVSSGSQGKGKAVRLSRRAFAASATASAANLGWLDDDRWLCTLPLAHIGGLSIVWRCLKARRCVVLDPRPACESFDATRLVDLIEQQRVTLVSVVPTMLARMVARHVRAPAALRAILVGGDAVSPRLCADAGQLKMPLVKSYGMTETCSQICAHHPTTPPEHQHGVGAPLSGVEVRIDAAQRVFVRGPMLLSGYGVPVAAAGFAAEGWFETGDLGRLDQAGILHILGRADATIITGGENVHPAEIEKVLLEHPDIEQAAVFGIPDPVWGQTVAAALVSSSLDQEATKEQLLALVEARLASYKRPRSLRFVAALPTLANGKIDRRSLASATTL